MPNYHSLNLVFVVCLFTILSISVLGLARQQPPSELRNITDAELKDVVVHLQRSTCYGNCPSYSVTVFGDGRIEYEGLKFVKTTGKKAGRIEPADLKRIVSEFEKANYFSLDQYTYDKCSCTLCTDMPTAITEIQARGKSHKVEHYYGCRCAPKALWDLEVAIDKFARTEQWTGDVSKAGPNGTTCFNK